MNRLHYMLLQWQVNQNLYNYYCSIMLLILALIDQGELNDYIGLTILSQTTVITILLLIIMSCLTFQYSLTALHYAVLVNSTQCVQHLVFRGSTIAHIPSADDKSQTPLMMAATNGHSDIINV